MMPFKSMQPGAFDLDTLKSMQAAFDEVCTRQRLDASDPRRSRLATILIEMATSGERSELAPKAEAQMDREGRPTRG